MLQKASGKLLHYYIKLTQGTHLMSDHWILTKPRPYPLSKYAGVLWKLSQGCNCHWIHSGSKQLHFRTSLLSLFLYFETNMIFLLSLLLNGHTQFFFGIFLISIAIDLYSISLQHLQKTAFLWWHCSHFFIHVGFALNILHTCILAREQFELFLVWTFC